MTWRVLLVFVFKFCYPGYSPDQSYQHLCKWVLVGSRFLSSTLSLSLSLIYAQSCLTLWDPMDCSPPGSLSSMGNSNFQPHLRTSELDHKEGWALKNWIVMLEKTLENPLDCKEIKPVNPEGYQPWIFFGSTFAEAEAPILCPSSANRLENTLILGKTEGKRRRWWQRVK